MNTHRTVQDYKLLHKLTHVTCFQFKTAFEVHVANVLTLHQLQLSIGVFWDIVFALMLTILSCTWHNLFIHPISSASC